MRPALKIIPGRREVAPEKAVLETRDLSMVFPAGDGGLAVLKNVTFTAGAGEMVCILGPSGCGKSTLLKILAGFLRPTGGEIWLGGKPVRRPGPERCVVFQEDALFPWLTVAENIAFGLKGRVRDRKARRAEVDRYLELVGLTAFGNYLPRDISGGMKQRVALARVLILQPRVLLMDEPFAALDAQTRNEMQDLLLRLWERFRHTILFVTHDVTEAALLADRILVMDRDPGRVRDIVPVPLARPRRTESDGFHSFYRELCGGLWR
jgi:NitT/TauT family transport system ATP-binding protein